jgi:hypothetical protein
MMCLDQLDRWSVQTHRSVLFAFEVLDEVEKKVSLESRMLDEAERMVLSSAVLAGSWYFLGPFS